MGDLGQAEEVLSTVEVAAGDENSAGIAPGKFVEVGDVVGTGGDGRNAILLSDTTRAMAMRRTSASAWERRNRFPATSEMWVTEKTGWSG